jgi:hypothetical protein
MYRSMWHKILGYFFHKVKIMYYFRQRMGWDKFWLIFFQTHLVTLTGVHIQLTNLGAHLQVFNSLCNSVCKRISFCSINLSQSMSMLYIHRWKFFISSMYEHFLYVSLVTSFWIHKPTCTTLYIQQETSSTFLTHTHHFKRFIPTYVPTS